MASGHVNRTQRPNTWLHRPNLQREDSSCQLGAVHTWPIALFQCDQPNRSLWDAERTSDERRAASGQKRLTHNGASPPSIDALQNDQSLRHASAIRLTGIWNIRWSITPV
jgi:hypothetical protein